MNTTPVRLNPNQQTDEFGEQETLVEHMTIPGFMSRFNHKWHMDDITKFGKQVGRAAEDMHLAYMTVNDRSLGVIRAFPVPLLARVYSLLRGQFGWPEVPSPVLSTPRGRSGAAAENSLEAQSRLAEHLQGLVAVAEPDVQDSIAVVLAFLDQRRTKV